MPCVKDKKWHVPSPVYISQFHQIALSQPWQCTLFSPSCSPIYPSTGRTAVGGGLGLGPGDLGTYSSLISRSHQIGGFSTSTWRIARLGNDDKGSITGCHLFMKKKWLYNGIRSPLVNAESVKGPTNHSSSYLVLLSCMVYSSSSSTESRGRGGEAIIRHRVNHWAWNVTLRNRRLPPPRFLKPSLVG